MGRRAGATGTLLVFSWRREEVGRGAQRARGGLLKRGDYASAHRAGLRKSRAPADAASPLLQYIPHPPEPVLGIIIARHAEGYRVDIGSSQAASLDALAFEGATKRSKPNLKARLMRFARRELDADPRCRSARSSTPTSSRLPPFRNPRSRAWMRPPRRPLDLASSPARSKSVV